MGMSGIYRQIGIIELKQLKSCELVFRLKQNRANIKGIEEYIRRFGVRKGRQKSGLTVEEIRAMLVVSANNIDGIMGEIESRLAGGLAEAERRNICKFRSGRGGRLMSWEDF